MRTIHTPLAFIAASLFLCGDLWASTQPGQTNGAVSLNDGTQIPFASNDMDADGIPEKIWIGGVLILVPPGGQVDFTIQPSGQKVRVVVGTPGDDTLLEPTSPYPCLMFGGNGDDTMEGGPQDDVMMGGNGSDNMGGNEGADTMQGGCGGDQLDGDDGNDNLEGESGNDKINGGKGDDTTNGGPGIDTSNGGPGNDVITDTSGEDILKGDAGDDTFKTNDDATTPAEKDTVDGGAGSDKGTLSTNDSATDIEDVTRA